jgi:hypothetical protein
MTQNDTISASLADVRIRFSHNIHYATIVDRVRRWGLPPFTPTLLNSRERSCRLAQC